MEISESKIERALELIHLHLADGWSLTLSKQKACKKVGIPDRFHKYLTATDEYKRLRAKEKQTRADYDRKVKQNG